MSAALTGMARWAAAAAVVTALGGAALASASAGGPQGPAPPRRLDGPAASGAVAARTLSSAAPLRAVLLEVGVTEADASAAVSALAELMDVENAVERRVDIAMQGDAPRRLLRLSVIRLGEEVRLQRTAGGFAASVVALRSAVTDPSEASPLLTQPLVLDGPMETILYGGPEHGGASDAVARRAIQLFARKLDFARDVRLGDRVRLVLEPDGAGRPTLSFAELTGASAEARLYRIEGAGSPGPQYLDEDARPPEQLLIRTPVADARVTSSFGPRRHPILNYTRQHQGVDFGAPAGAKVVAAAPGVVAEAGWSGGYGRIVRVRHQDGLETLYAHLSRWPAGLEAGRAVRQGQVIGFVGSSGLSTGPHLHYEVRRAGRPVDPASVRALSTSGPPLEALEVLRRERRRIAELLAKT